MLELLNKYLDKPSDLRLVVILETYGKKTNKQTISTLKMLVEDYVADNNISPIYGFLQLPVPVEAIPLNIGPMNDDDFVLSVKKLLGDPKDEKSLGNRILTGQTSRFNLRTYYKPNILLRKFALLAGKESQELDQHPTNIKSGGEPVWDCCILGTHQMQHTMLSQTN